MRLILILLALLAIGLLAARQLGPLAPDAAPATAQSTDHEQPPKVPTRPQDLKNFSRDMDQFMQDTDRRRREEIEKRSR